MNERLIRSLSKYIKPTITPIKFRECNNLSTFLKKKKQQEAKALNNKIKFK